MPAPVSIRLALKRLPDTDEWRVSYLENGRLNDDKSYYTTDRQDAVATLRDMKARLQAKGTAVQEELEGSDSLSATPAVDGVGVASGQSQAGGEELPPSPERLQAYLDQVLLRIFSASPGLSSYVESYRVVPGSGHIEVSFFKVPDEVVSAIHQAFGVPAEELRYTKNSAACIGFRVKPTRDDLASLGVDDGDQDRSADDPLEHSTKDEAEGAGLTVVGVESDAWLPAPTS